jgi:hypothetical protein
MFIRRNYVFFVIASPIDQRACFTPTLCPFALQAGVMTAVALLSTASDSTQGKLVDVSEI